MTKYILYLKQTGFDFYNTEIHANYVYTFSPELVKDMELLNEDMLHDSLQLFLTNGKFVQGPITVLLSDSILFVKEFFKSEQALEKDESGVLNLSSVTVENNDHEGSFAEELKAQIDSYLKSVPFENVTSKVIRLPKGFRVVATNKDFYTVLVNAFRRSGFAVDQVLPITLLTKKMQNSPVVTPEIIQLVMQNPDILKQNNFLFMETAEEHHVREVTNESSSFQSSNEGTKPSNKRAVVLGVFLSLLLLVLGIMVYFNFIKKPNPVPVANTTGTENTILEPTSVTLAPADLRIEIVTAGTGSSSATLRLKEQLLAAGYTNVKTPTSTLSEQVAGLSFSSRVPSDQRAKIVEITQSVSPQIPVTENSANSSDVQINL